MKIRPVGAELFRVDGQTDRRTDGHDKAISHFLKFFELAISVHGVMNRSKFYYNSYRSFFVIE
jgi:hypothetical protein